MKITIYLPYKNVFENVHSWALQENDIDFRKDLALAKRCTLSYGATEVEKYLKQQDYQVTFADNDSEISSDGIVIHIDCGDASDEICRFELSSQENEVFIYGDSRTGGLYGCYELLRLQGIRWLSPQSDIVPAPQGAFIFPEKKSYAPDMPLGRGFDLEGPLKESTNLWAWMAHNRLNVSSYRPNTWKFQKKLGMQFKVGGHIFEPLLDPDNFTEDGRTFWEAHRDWYGSDTKETALHVQFCTSNQELSEYLSQAVLEHINKEWYYADRIDIWGFDTWGKVCQCEKCKKLGNGSDRFLKFISYLRDYLDRALADGRLDHNIRMVICAYEGTSTLEPPVNGIPKNLQTSGDYIVYYPILRCYEHPINYDCSHNRIYHETLEGWKGIPLTIGEYYNVSKFEDLPLLFSRTMGDDLRYYSKNATGMTYMHLPMVEWGVRNLTQLYYAQLCWDLNTDREAFLKEYFSLRYSKYADQVRAAYEKIENAFVQISSWRSWKGTDLLSKLQLWDGAIPKAPLAEDDHLGGNAENLGIQMLEKLEKALALLEDAYHKAVEDFADGATVLSGLSYNPADKRYFMTGEYADHLSEDIRLVRYGYKVMELMVLYTRYYNACYHGEDTDALWEEIYRKSDEAAFTYSHTAYASSRFVEMDERDILQRAQLKSLFYKCLKFRRSQKQ